MDILYKYFPSLSEQQRQQFAQLFELYTFWNQRINVISRKDIDHLYERHVLHSLSILKTIHFKAKDRILDVGTGGGFPGVPLAIMAPESHFLLIDSIGKKIRVVQEVIKALQLTNVEAKQINAKEITGKYEYIVSRAVCTVEEMVQLTKKNTLNGTTKLIMLKGGDLTAEIKPFENSCQIIPISNFFDEPFFETKKIVILHA